MSDLKPPPPPPPPVEAKTEPKLIEPSAPYPIPGVHIDPNTVDGDRTMLEKDFRKLAVTLWKFKDDSLRVRDEERARNKRLADDNIALTATNAKLHKDVEELSAVLRLVQIDRDDARKDYAELAQKYRTLEEAHLALEARLTKRVAELVNEVGHLKGRELLASGPLPSVEAPVASGPLMSFNVVNGIGVTDVKKGTGDE